MSRREAPARAIVDTDIIFSRVLHELIGRIATQLRLLDLLWSDELLDQAQRSLIKRKALSCKAAQRWVGYLRQALPEGRTAIEQSNQDLASLTVDPDDQHGVATCRVGTVS